MDNYPPFINGSFNGRSPAFDAQRTINMYVEGSESGSSKTGALLVGAPGLRLFAQGGTGPVRGMIKFNEQTGIVVIGPTVYAITHGGALTALSGSVDAFGTPVSMASNGNLIMLVTGPNGYFINPVLATVTKITDPDFYGGDRICFIDGYFIWNRPYTGQYQISQLYGTDIDGLDFATAESAPDPLVSLIADHGQLVLLGSDSVEFHADSGDSDFPFQRINGAFLEIGCAAKHSVAKMDNTVYWLATDERGYGTIQRAAGYTPQRASNHAVEFAIASYSDVSDAVAYTYSQEGHSFYVISFPSGNATWVFDAASNLWHERAYMKTDGSLNRHRSHCQMNFANETLVGDWENGKIYAFDLDVFTDNGDTILASRAWPHISENLGLQFFHSVEIDMQTGVGLESGATPNAMLSWSDDGGVSFSDERIGSVGRIGERTTRVRWRRLGRSRDRVYKVSITDPVRRVFIGASISATKGKS
jgi:Phage stabilisation protein